MTRHACTALLVSLLAACAPTGGGTGAPEADVAADEVDAAAGDDVAGEDDAFEADTTIPDEPREFTYGAVGRILHVIDGDTVVVNVGQVAPVRYRVRLQGINAPECLKKDVKTSEGDWIKACAQDDEFYGLASYEGLVALAEGKEVTITCDNALATGWCPQDDYDRYLAYLDVNGQDLSTQMVWRGLAFTYTVFYASKRAELCAAEYDAREKGRGMWAFGSVSEILGMMSEHTQSWYQSHDARCDQALH